MNNTERLEEMVLELAGIKDTLILLSDQFSQKQEPCKFDNNTISGALNTIAYHVGRISEELDTVSTAQI